jgi:hypothetical protein
MRPPWRSERMSYFKTPKSDCCSWAVNRMGGYTVADRVIYEVGTSSNSLPLILTFPTSMKVG